MPVIGFWEILFVLVLLTLLFGAKKIPLIARGLGEGIRNFKGEVKKKDDGDEDRRLQGDRDSERD